MDVNYDLDAMSKSELEKLRADVESALKSLDARRKADARKAVEEAAKQHGFKLDELLRTDTKGKKSPPKYRHPEDPGLTWTGKGRKPRWLNEQIESGKTLEDLKIT